MPSAAMIAINRSVPAEKVFLSMIWSFRPVRYENGAGLFHAIGDVVSHQRFVALPLAANLATWTPTMTGA